MSRRYRNRRIGDFLKELDLTEGRPTGVPKMLKAMAANGSQVPLFETDQDRLSYVVRLPVYPQVEQATNRVTPEVTPEATPEVLRVASVLTQALSRQELQEAVGLTVPEHFRKAYLRPALDSGLVEMTLPDTPTSPSQRYRLTTQGKKWLASQGKTP